MPLQNRVTPFGEVVAVPERGGWMGNRGGCFHTADRRLTRRRWAGRRWLVCLLEFRGRHRTVMAPGCYTELFFLDEATALAAGHRPCRECRRADHERFKEAWRRGNPGAVADGAGIDALDAVLHRERLTPAGTQRTFRARLGDLPAGVFVALPRGEDEAYLFAEKRLWRWAPRGYAAAPRRWRGETEVTVLTPRSTVRAIAAGYTPQVHGLG
jgi:hypothetical protein